MTTADPQAVDPLRALSDRLHGELVRPGDPGYHRERAVRNGMIELSTMRAVRVDPDALWVRVQGGATWADVVTAAGERNRASEDQKPGLFWGRRGAGGTFGVATSLEFELHRQLTDDAPETIRDHADPLPGAFSVVVIEPLGGAAARVGAASGENYEGLVEVKNERDPDNFFRMNSNVEPTV